MNKKTYYRFKAVNLNEFATEMKGIADLLQVGVDCSQLNLNPDIPADLEKLASIGLADQFLRGFTPPFIVELLLKYHTRDENGVFEVKRGRGHYLQFYYDKLCHTFQKKLQSKYKKIKKKKDYYDDGSVIIDSVDKLIQLTNSSFETQRYKHCEEVDSEGNLINQNPSNVKQTYIPSLTILIRALYLLSDLPTLIIQHNTIRSI